MGRNESFGSETKLRMDPTNLKELKLFIDQCKVNPSILASPSLSFFCDYLESLGAKLPSAAYKEEDTKASSFGESDEDMEETDSSKETEEEEVEDEIIESDLELEGETVEPDNDPPQKMGDPSVEVTDENREAAQEAKGKGMEAISEGKLDEAIEHLTEAIMLNPASAMYNARAKVYTKLKKRKAAFRDDIAALEMLLQEIGKKTDSNLASGLKTGLDEGLVLPHKPLVWKVYSRRSMKH